MTSSASNAQSMRLTGRAATVVCIVPLAGIAVLILLAIFVPRDINAGLLAMFVAMIASFGLVGAVLVVRLPRNLIGWILWLVATLVAVALGGSDYSGYSAEHLAGLLPGTVLIAWLSHWLFIPAIGLALIFVPLLFPDGHLPSPRWRPVALFGTVAIAGAALSAFQPGPLSNVEAIQNPFGEPALVPLIDALGFPPGALLPPAILAALASTVVRFHQGTQVERRQIKWFSAVLLVTFLVFSLAPDQLSFFGIALLPIGIGVAVLRYRLYEIDRIISRTVAYAIVMAILGGVLVGAILIIQAVLEPMTGGGTLAVAGSTLLVAVLFQPLRRRTQTVVDRRFNRAQYDAQRTVEVFAGRIRDQVDLNQLGAEVESVVDRALQPARIVMWLREGSR